MRLHLIILRHGLPATRILWTTTSSPSFHASGPGVPYGGPPASSSAIASTRYPNSAYGNGGYTIAQLLEDVNEVIPLETDGKASGENDEFGGQWGLEDYVVEVGGFECLHFMEVEGLLRDGDEVVIRALQTADLRARRISGRHQISADGRHLIDGVPFGRPYLKRSFSSRPAIRIPPRKRRRTNYFGWNDEFREGEDDANWPDLNTGRRHALLDEESIHSSDQGTVIRHPTRGFEDVQGSESDADTSDIDEEELNEELKGLKEDLEAAEALEAADPESPRATRSGRVSRLRHRGPAQAAADSSPSRASSASASHPRSDSVAEPSTKASKNVRFQKVSDSEDSDSSSVSDESDEPEESSETEEESSSEAESPSEAESSDTSDASSSVVSTTDTSETSSVSDSESESEPEMVPPAKPKVQPKMNPPGKGSAKTKKSNRRNKLRRRLKKLKELGYLPPNANFADLRAWEAANGSGGPLTEVKDLGESRSSQAREQSEFEARRQQLLRQLESGGIDVDAHSEKENIPPRHGNGNARKEPHGNAETEVAADATVEETPETAKRRKLDVVSSRRLLFGSLGVKAPKSKEDEEAARQKLAGPARPQSLQQKDVEQAADEGTESDLDENWQEKLVVKATECVYEDINLNPPGFPFKQRWDAEAREMIRQRKNNENGGRNGKKKRKRKYRDWQEEGWYDGTNEDTNGDVQLEYDEQPSQINGALKDTTGDQGAPSTDDLPLLPDDLTSVPDLVESEVREGAIIAFKQLDVSKATNWQPQVSKYRVAEVDSVMEDGTISVRLAKRDRERREPNVNEDGVREYSGFEMPGFEDEESEDDGFRRVSFGELIEPKLLQPAERAAAAQVEVNGKDAIPSDSEDASAPASAPGDDRRAPGEAITPSVEVELPAVSTQTRNEISEIIRDAGFRSALDSELQEPDLLKTQAESNHQDTAEGEPSPIVRSPAFEGFSSSPPEVESSRPGAGDAQSRPHSPTRSPPALTDEGEAVQDDPTKSPTSYQIPRSSGSDAAAESQPVVDYHELPSLSDQPENPASTPSRLDETVENPSKGEQVDSPQEPSASAAEEPAVVLTSRADAVRETPSSHSDASSTVPNPFYLKDRAYEKRFQQAIDKSQGSETLDDTFVGGESSFEFPSVETIFRSTAPARSTGKLDSPTPKSKRNALSSPRQRSPSPATSGGRAPVGDEVRSTSPPVTTQVVVDLTMSSPPESLEGSDEEFARSRDLPRGPGWVQKNVPATRRQTRSSTGARGLDLGSSSPPRRRRAGLRRSG